MQEQVTYLQPAAPDTFAPERFPVWIWMDDPSFYGFPCYGATTIKSAEDCGGHQVDPHTRSGDVEPEAERRLVDFVRRLLPASGTTVTGSKTCLYTLTPDRDFALGPLPGHEGVIVGLAAAHGMKFAPTFGRAAGRAGPGRTHGHRDRAVLPGPAGVDGTGGEHQLAGLAAHEVSEPAGSPSSRSVSSATQVVSSCRVTTPLWTVT